jgi:zinc transport system substrate-binding protein
MKKNTKLIVLVLLAVSAMQSVSKVVAEDRLTVYTVNYPLQYFAQRIAGEHADVVFPAPPDIDPVFWTPDAKTVSAYQSADLVLLNGADYAKWINKVSLSRKRLVNTSSVFTDAYIHIDTGVKHSHGAGKDHSHAGTAFTTWLDLRQALKQAEAIKQALIKERPQYKQVFDSNFEQLAKDLQTLDGELDSIISAERERAMLASHPVYQYLARRYNMNLHSVMWEPDVTPAESEWSDIKGLADKHSARWMIWEAEPLTESVARLEQLGIKSVIFNPSANVLEQGDFLAVMKKNVAALRRAFLQSD